MDQLIFDGLVGLNQRASSLDFSGAFKATNKISIFGGRFTLSMI